MIHHIAEELATVSHCGIDISGGRGQGRVRGFFVDCSDCLHQMRKEMLRELQDHVEAMLGADTDWPGTMLWRPGRIDFIHGEVTNLTRRITASLIKEGKT